MALGAEDREGRMLATLPTTQYATDRGRVERAYNERRQTQQAAEEQQRVERAPERPEQVVSENLFNEEARQQIQNIRNNSELTEQARRALIVAMIKSNLPMDITDRSQLANTIATQIGQHAELHGAAEAARRMIEHGDRQRAAEMLYDTFYIREVSGRGRGGAAPITQRRSELRVRVQRVNTELNSRTETLIPENRSATTAITAAAAAGGTRITTGILPGITVPGARAPGPQPTNNPPASAPQSIAARNRDEAMRSFAEIVRAGGGSIT
jgi:hypothetical protein